MISKHHSRQVMVFVHWGSTLSLRVLNMGSKHDLRQHKKLVYWLHTTYLCWIWDRNLTLGKWWNSCIDAGYVYFCAECEPQIWHALSQDIRVFELDVQPVCTEYGLGTWLAQSDENRLLALDMQPISPYTGHKHDISYLKVFVYWNSTYTISVLYMVSRNDSRSLMKFAEYGPETWLAASDEIRVLCSICRLSLLNKVSNLYLRQLKSSLYYCSR